MNDKPTPPQPASKPAVKDASLIQYVPQGCVDEIKLSVNIVKNLLVSKTKSGANCSDRDALRFIAMCSARRVNPFEGDAFLIGYDTKDGPMFSIIVAELALLKRAELHPQYDGMESGLTVQTENGSVEDIKGEWYPEGKVCVAGWARVTRKDRSTAEFERLPLKKNMRESPFSFDDVPEKEATRLLRAKTGLLQQLGATRTLQ